MRHTGMACRSANIHAPCRAGGLRVFALLAGDAASRMSAGARPANVDAYIAGCAPALRPLLQQVRETLAAAAPAASEKISYGIPTFHLHGNLIHYAAFANHVGLYPGASAIVEFAAALQPYHTARGTIRLPLDAPLPLALIGRIVAFRIAENTQRAAARKTRRRASESGQ